MTGLEQQTEAYRSELRTLVMQHRGAVQREAWEELPLRVWDLISLLNLPPMAIVTFVEVQTDATRLIRN